MLRVKECAESAAVAEKVWELKDFFGKPEVPDSPHTADIATIDDIDFEGMYLEATVKAEEFWEKVQRAKRLGVFDQNQPEDKMLAARRKLKGDDVWLDMHVSEALWKMGLRHRTSHDEPFIDEPFTLEDLKTKYRWYFEFGTFAVLDDSGWHEKGKMGWFGMTTAGPSENEQWGTSFTKQFLEGESPDTTIVICDCHI
jgi:hypothetical protein